MLSDCRRGERRKRWRKKRDLPITGLSSVPSEETWITLGSPLSMTGPGVAPRVSFLGARLNSESESKEKLDMVEVAPQDSWKLTLVSLAMFACVNQSIPSLFIKYTVSKVWRKARALEPGRLSLNPSGTELGFPPATQK